MSKYAISCAVMAAAVCMSLSCGNDHPSQTLAPASGESEAFGTVRLNVSFAPRTGTLAKTAGTEAIDVVSAYVYDPKGAALLSEDLTLSEGRATGRLTVTALDNLKVVLAYYDGPVVQYIGQDEDVDVPHGGEATADIVEYYLGISVTAPDTAFIGEKYTVSWEEKPLATGYELQESARTIYQGVDTFTIIEPKDVEGSYLYRARVNTPYGFGPWHRLGAVSTGVYVKEGTLDIDVPVPGDDIHELMFAAIPAGSFEMGSDAGEADQQPAHTVTLDEFEMSIYEITNEQYSDYLNAALAAGDITVTAEKATGAKGDYSGQEYIRLTGALNTLVKSRISYQNGVFSVESGREYLPVIYVSWYGARAFAEYYDLDLPTEAEWEYAARGGKQYDHGTNDGTINSNNANYYRFFSVLTDVGSFPENPYGLCDMSGNVWEWCSDWYGDHYYSSSPENNPTGPSEGVYRISRGCDWYTRVATELLVLYRKTDLPVTVSPYIGFRVVRR